MEAGIQKQTRGDQKSGLIVCAWCSRYIGTMKGAERVSHGICLECKTLELARWGISNPLAGSHGARQAGPSLVGVSTGEGAEAGAILQTRLGKVSRTAEENKHRLVTLYRIAVDEVKPKEG